MKKYTKNGALKHLSAHTATHKRKKKDAVRALEEMVRSLGMETSGVKFSDTEQTTRHHSKQGNADIAAEGVFSSSKSGFGFVSVAGMERDVFIPEENTHGAIDGDTVEIRYHTFTSRRFAETKTEGTVVRIVDGVKTLIGTLAYTPQAKYARSYRRTLTVLPDRKSLHVLPHITESAGANVGDKVEVLLHRHGELTGEVIRIFGDTQSKEANYAAILSECDIATEFSPEVLAQAKASALRPLGEGRVDRRRQIIFTMDGASAKDLDDAVSLTKQADGGWKLGVHIADVSYYVEERTPLDRSAMKRGTSVYFTDKVVPMLPTSLSNGACSLNAGEDKAALSAIVTLSPDGKILKTDITASVIRSRVRGVYSEINDVLAQGKASGFYEKYAGIYASLSSMRALYKVLKAKRQAAGSVALETEEAEILLDDEGNPTQIRRRTRGVAEEMIEQFMLTANEAVATLMKEKHLPCVYRVHAKPPAEKVHTLLSYLQGIGIDIRGLSADTLTGKDLNRILSDAEKRGLSVPVSYTVLRSMAKAEYCAEPLGHFGLATENYCHFTSPIRRLSDLAVHRILRRVLLENESPDRYRSYANRAAAAATEAEQRALEAERRIDDLYKVVYMSDKIGEIFPAVVSSVTSFGVFCTMENTCEGLIPLSELIGYYTFDEKTLSLRSRDVTYRLGDAFPVRVEEADLSTGKLRLSDARFFMQF